MYVAVYGSLMSGLYNHKAHLENKAELVGTFQTEPIYNLIDLGAYPGLTKKGSTSVTMEIYDIDDIVLQNLDRLESYRPEDKESSYYNRELIETPYGEAYCYFFNLNTKGSKKVTHGNWREHVTRVRKK